MAYHSFLVEPISCHAWNKDHTRECPHWASWDLNAEVTEDTTPGALGGKGPLLPLPAPLSLFRDCHLPQQP